MAPSEVSDLSKDDLATLHHLSDLVHLFNHRNLNQHRHSIWWRHFSIFRRHLNATVQDLSDLQAVPETHLQRIRKVKKDENRHQNLSQRMALWQDVLVPKWHRCFSQIVADGVFAVLGIFLLAVLSEVCQIVGVTARFEDLGQDEVERVIEDFGNEYWAAADQKMSGVVEAEDLGEVVTREKEVLGRPGPVDGGSKAVETTHATPRSKAAKRKKDLSKSAASVKKKRKKGNAIDDLFSGLD